jgi:alkylated DNA repair dioxygenase AlkB
VAETRCFQLFISEHTGARVFRERSPDSQFNGGRGDSTLKRRFAFLYLIMPQLSFFETEETTPDGLIYRQDFVSAKEEDELIARFANLPLAPFQFGAFEGKRRVASFGWKYDYSAQRLTRTVEIPAWIKPLIARVEEAAALRDAVQQILFTEYVPGAGIGWHRDKRAFGTVCGLSLASSCPFRFRRTVGATWQRYTLSCDRRSLYGMSGSARSLWEHSIAQSPSALWRTPVVKLASGLRSRMLEM